MYLLLLLLWIALNGKFTLEIFIFGIIISSAIYAFMCKCLEYSPSSDKVLFTNVLHGITYIFVLLFEVAKSGITVLKFVLQKKIDIQPQIVVFRVPLKTEFLKTLLANSITLTPGTITVNVDGDVFYVHALDYTLVEGIETCTFVEILKKMEDTMGVT